MSGRAVQVASTPVASELEAQVFDRHNGRGRFTGLELPYSAPDLLWSNIYSHWKRVSETINSAARTAPQFLQVEAPHRVSDYDRLPSLDWWQKSEERRGGCKQGTLHTAILLWLEKDCLERQHAVFIMASLWDKLKAAPDNWRGAAYQVLEDVWDAMHIQFPDIDSWHSASREALPFSMMHYTGDMLVPKTPRELIYITAVEAALVAANWQLVEYVNNISPNLHLLKSD